MADLMVDRGAESDAGRAASARGRATETRRRFSTTRRAHGLALSLAALSLGVVSTGTAGADNVSCGTQITANTTLHADVGPCPGNGLVVTADKVTLDLNGHRIFGSEGPADGNAAGIRLPMRSGVVVRNGTVSGFDAGVVIRGGSGNTIDSVVVRDNVGPDDPNTAELGDGIVLFFSAKNTISNNVVTGNGIYDGIGVLGWDSNGNKIVGNRVEANVGSALRPWLPGAGTGVLINPFFGDPNDPRRGDSISDNRVENNVVVNNANSGISNISNVRGVIVGNTVVANGSMTNPDVWPGNGIGVSALLMATDRTAVLVQDNEVHGNANDGIQVTTLNNRILNNNAANNAANGQLNYDLKDFSDANGDHIVDGKCNSVWYGNTWGSAGYYPDCVTKGGTGPNPPPKPGPPSSTATADPTTPRPALKG